MNKVFVVGGASVDKIIHLDRLPEPKAGTIFSKGSFDMVGSTGCGKAISLHKLGMDITFHAMVGSDHSGDYIVHDLEKHGVPFLYDIDPAGTEEHVNLMDDSGNRISIYTKYATFEPEVNYDRLETYVTDSEYIVLNIINYARKVIPIAKKHAKKIWCDIHDYDGVNEYQSDFIEAADYIFMSSDQMKDYKPYMLQLIEHGKEMVVCTHGKDGATAITKQGDFIELPILPKYQRTDTNGAGDNFFAGFLYAYDKGYPIRQCLQYGTIVAGLCITSDKIVYPELSKEMVDQEYQKYYR